MLTRWWLKGDPAETGRVELILLERWLPTRAEMRAPRIVMVMLVLALVALVGVLT